MELVLLTIALVLTMKQVFLGDVLLHIIIKWYMMGHICISVQSNFMEYKQQICVGFIDLGI